MCKIPSCGVQSVCIVRFVLLGHHGLVWCLVWSTISCFLLHTLELFSIQLLQLTLSVQSMKLKDKTESLRGIFMNKFIKISHAW